MKPSIDPGWPCVTSRGNTSIKRIVALRHRRERAEREQCWLESRACVHAALHAGERIDQVAVSLKAQPGVYDLARRAAARGAAVITYTEDCFRKLSILRHPDGIGAVIHAPPACALKDSVAPIVMLWQLQDPGNAGSIVRSAAAMGCGTVVVVEPGVDLLHPRCLRATAGTIFGIRYAVADASAATAWLARRAERVALLAADGDTTLEDARDTPPDVLVIGGEAHGIPSALRARHRSVAIPMRNGMESLNVNAAAAIALHALWGQRITRVSRDADSALPRART
jgi:TrmH family RNA methyltransferase